MINEVKKDLYKTKNDAIFSHYSSGNLYYNVDALGGTIESLNETDWKIQLDNELPKVITGSIFIPMGIYHRVIKGTGNLKIKLKKL